MASSPSAVTVPPAAITPSTGQRLRALDILRGLAILGMIVVHFHQRLRLEVGGVEDLIPWGVWVLIEQKSWGIFAFLFGVGFALFLRRLEARGDPVVPIYLRRLGALAVFGVIAEAVFGFNILFTYACWGLVLLLVRRWSSGALLALALAAVCARPLATWWTGAPVPPPTPPRSAAVFPRGPRGRLPHAGRRPLGAVPGQVPRHLARAAARDQSHPLRPRPARSAAGRHR